MNSYMPERENVCELVLFDLKSQGYFFVIFLGTCVQSGVKVNEAVLPRLPRQQVW